MAIIRKAKKGKINLQMFMTKKKGNIEYIYIYNFIESSTSIKVLKQYHNWRYD